MKRWHVYGMVTATRYLGEFEAETEEEAVNMGLSGPRSSVSLCHACAHVIDDPQIDDANAEEIP